jgi:predicted phosphodiesterase
MPGLLESLAPGCLSPISHVLKIRNEYSIAPEQALQWCSRQIVRESSWQIYHPSRTWVVLRSETGCATANITQRLPTLSSVISDPDPEQDSLRLGWLIKLSRFYFNFLREHGLRQDEGLTNYGVDQGVLWYLDDDIYQPDQGVGFSHSLAGYVRSQPWLDEVACQSLGDEVRQLADVLGANGGEMVWRQIQDAFIPPEREPLRMALGRGLVAQPVTRRRLDLSRPVAVLADIHANGPALDAVLADVQTQGVEQMLVLGDIVGYGPDPARCVDVLAGSDALVIRGNHDQAASSGTTGQGFSRAASWSVPWTWHKLSEEQRSWLMMLPLCLRQERIMAVHGAPKDPNFFNAYVYAMTSDGNLDYLAERGLQACFHGHSHMPGCWYRDRVGRSGFTREPELELHPQGHYLICPGSVGQPRDGSHDASYLIWWPEQARVLWRSVSYDHAALVAKLKDAGFPDFVVRLFSGVSSPEG